MMMVESTIISGFSFILMIYETWNRFHIIVRKIEEKEDLDNTEAREELMA